MNCMTTNTFGRHIWGFESNDVELKTACAAGWSRADLVWERLLEDFRPPPTGPICAAPQHARTFVSLRLKRVIYPAQTAINALPLISGVPHLHKLK